MADSAVIIPNEGRALWLPGGSDAIFGAGTPEFVLFAADEAITLDSTWSDFLEADFSGYAREAVTLGGVFLNGDNLQEQDFAPVGWVHDGGGTSNSIYGWLLLHDAGSGTPVIMAGQNFDPPRSMAAITDSIDVVLNCLFDPNAP